MKNACKDCLYYHNDNNTCQYKKMFNTWAWRYQHFRSVILYTIQKETNEYCAD